MWVSFYMLEMTKSHLRILLRPGPRFFIIRRSVRLINMRNFRNQWVCRIGVRQERQNTEKHLGNRECWTPLTLQNIKADAPRCVDIRMIDFGAEGYNRWLERIVSRKADAEFEDAATKGGVRRPEYHGLPSKEIGLTCGSRCTICRWVILNLGQFTLKSS